MQLRTLASPSTRTPLHLLVLLQHWSRVGIVSNALQESVTVLVLFFFFRFSSLNAHAALKAGALFDSKTWPEDVQELATYREADLYTLLKRFWSPLERNIKFLLPKIR